jgi:hypothetical protein
LAWLELFERFQGAIAAWIAALIGFSGIIITIRSNARMAEKVRKDQRSQEKDALIATLYSEVTTFRDFMDENLLKLDEAEDIFLHPLHNEDTFLDECVGNLGLLNKGTISKVLRAYLAWQEIPRKLILEFGESAKIRNDYILVTKERKERCKAVLLAARAPVVQAVEALDRESALRERSTSSRERSTSS